ncbi:uncharacterized protein LOC142584459 [Dermacentor variabilis]|uniref:uncharacterized protein LOC142584459 n=1 Tax=Dermacentor variabilis TaxID=34621 RepID=UPI003F5B1016
MAKVVSAHARTTLSLAGASQASPGLSSMRCSADSSDSQRCPAHPPGGSVAPYTTALVHQDPSSATSSFHRPLNLQLSTCFASGHGKVASMRTCQIFVLLTQHPTSWTLLL